MRFLLRHVSPLLRFHVRNNKCVANNEFNRRYSAAYELDIKVNDVSLNKYLRKIESEYKENISNEYYRTVMQLLEKRKSVIENINNVSEMLNDNDKELRKLAEEEKEQYENEIKLLDEELSEAVLPPDQDEDCNSIVVEVNAGVGGQEAMLFASELFEMYCGLAQYKNWECVTAEYLTSDLGGLRHGSLLIKGRNVFSYFKHEAGVHRVQRIPETEKAGRIHTSTVSVNALPQPTNIEVNIDNKDLRIETKRATGAGGQHVNTTDSAVRITHIPTGVSIECQVDRSQIKNRQMAMERLRAKLYQMQLDQQLAETSAVKKQQVRSNFRNEKIRTYNFSQDRITDHRLQSNNVHNIKVFMMGGQPLDELINKLRRSTQISELLESVFELEKNNKK